MKTGKAMQRIYVCGPESGCLGRDDALDILKEAGIVPNQGHDEAGHYLEFPTDALKGERGALLSSRLRDRLGYRHGQVGKLTVTMGLFASAEAVAGTVDLASAKDVDDLVERVNGRLSLAADAIRRLLDHGWRPRVEAGSLALIPPKGVRTREQAERAVRRAGIDPATRGVKIESSAMPPAADVFDDL